MLKQNPARNKRKEPPTASAALLSGPQKMLKTILKLSLNFISIIHFTKLVGNIGNHRSTTKESFSMSTEMR